MLLKEADICKELDGGTGFARLCWYGDEGEYQVLVQEYLGPSLQDLLTYCGGCFSLKTVLLIADQALTRLEYMHNRGMFIATSSRNTSFWDYTNKAVRCTISILASPAKAMSRFGLSKMSLARIRVSWELETTPA